MSVLSDMERVLSQLGLYQLKENSLVSCEIKAYAAGFQLVEDRLEQLLEDAFVQTASETALQRREQLYPDHCWKNPTLEVRRSLLLKMIAITQNDNTVEGLMKSYEALGVKTQLSMTSDDKLNIEVTEHHSGITQPVQLNQLRTQMSPAHLMTVTHFMPAST